MACGSGAHNRPLTRCSISERGPPASTASTGTPLAWASSTTWPKVSVALGNTNMSALAYAAGSCPPSSQPRKVARSPSRSASCPRSGPSPASSRCNPGHALAGQQEGVREQLDTLLAGDPPGVEDRYPAVGHVRPAAGPIPQHGREALPVHTPVPAHHALGGDAQPRQRLVGGLAGGEDDVAGAVEGPHRELYRRRDRLAARPDLGVGGQLGVVAADQRQPHRPRHHRADDPDRARRGHVDRLEASVRQRLHGGCQARNADPQTGVEGDLDLGHRRQAAVHLRVGAHHLDLEPGDAPLAYLLDRACHPVGRADAVGQQRHPGPVAAFALAPGAHGSRG